MGVYNQCSIDEIQILYGPFMLSLLTMSLYALLARQIIVVIDLSGIPFMPQDNFVSIMSPSLCNL